MRPLFCVYLLLLILRPQEFIGALIGVPLLQYLLLACLALWVASKDKRADLPQYRLLLLFLVWVSLSLIMSGWSGGIIFALAQLVPVAGIFVIASMATRELRMLRIVMSLIVVCACLLVFYCMVQLEIGVGPWTGIQPLQGRPYYVGIFSDPNDLGQLFVVALAFTVNAVQAGRGLLARIALLGVISWLFYGIVLTDSRGDLLAALAILGLEAWHRYGKIVAGIAAALTLPALFALTRLSQLSADEESANDRIESWYEGFQMVFSNPVFGVGYGNFTDHNALTAHNSIVLPMAELGVPGLMIWLGIVWYCLWMLYWIAYGPHAKPAPDAAGSTPALSPAVKAEVLAGRGLFMAFLGFSIASLFLSQTYKAPLFLICGFAVARFVAASRVLPNPPTFRLVGDAPRLFGITLGCMATFWVIVKVNT